VLHRRERARKATGQTIGQQAEGLVRLRAVVPRNRHPRGRGPSVGAVAREAATARGVPRASRETCVRPRPSGNISLAGQRAWIAQLHRPGDARLVPWRPHLPFPVPKVPPQRRRLSGRTRYAGAHVIAAWPPQPTRPARSRPHRPWTLPDLWTRRRAHRSLQNRADAVSHKRLSAAEDKRLISAAGRYAEPRSACLRL
jgi:hypothetical protein